MSWKSRAVLDAPGFNSMPECAVIKWSRGAFIYLQILGGILKTHFQRKFVLFVVFCENAKHKRRTRQDRESVLWSGCISCVPNKISRFICLRKRSEPNCVSREAGTLILINVEALRYYFWALAVVLSDFLLTFLDAKNLSDTVTPINNIMMNMRPRRIGSSNNSTRHYFCAGLFTFFGTRFNCM